MSFFLRKRSELCISPIYEVTGFNAELVEALFLAVYTGKIRGSLKSRIIYILRRILYFRAFSVSCVELVSNYDFFCVIKRLLMILGVAGWKFPVSAVSKKFGRRFECE